MACHGEESPLKDKKKQRNQTGKVLKFLKDLTDPEKAVSLKILPTTAD